MSQYREKPPQPPIVEAFHLQKDNLVEFIEWAAKHGLKGWTVTDHTIHWPTNYAKPTQWIVKQKFAGGPSFIPWGNTEFQNKFDPIETGDNT